MKIFKKLTRYMLIILISIFVIINLAILLTGRLYIYKAIGSTYFRGVPKPTIYDQDIFNSRTISKGAPENWNFHEKLNSIQISKKQTKRIESLGTVSFLVAKGNTIIYEKYWGTHGPNVVGNSFSMSKSVVALLIGVALKEGKIKSLDEPVANYLEEFKGEKSNITIRHVLTMSTGLSWSEVYWHPFCDVAELYYDTDARDLCLNRRTIDGEPGKVWTYKSGDTQILMYILMQATGQNVSEYASEKIWSKIGAESDALWSLVGDENSEEKSYCCIYATTRDFAKLGRLINNNGKWNGKEVIDSTFISEFKQPAKLDKPNGKANQFYGFQYWIYKGLPYEVTYFRGLGGQSIISIPSKDLVIVRTGSKTLANWENTKSVKNDELEGHRIELPDYINIGLSILKQAEND